MKYEKYVRNLRNRLFSPFRDVKHILATLGITALSFALLILASDPQYTILTLSFGLHLIGEGLFTLTSNMVRTSGVLGLVLTALYSILIGITSVNFYERVKKVGIKGFRQLPGILPGFLAAGCAGCGIGLLSFLGYASIAASAPFAGNLIKAGGLAIMVGILAGTGDPRKCSIPSS
jgi:hypothetical protein